MAVIQFTEADKLASRIMEKGAERAVLSELEQKVSSSQKSVNFWATFKIINGPFMGKELKCCFNTETSEASLLGTMKFFPHSALMKVKAAVDNVKFESLDFSQPLDTDTIMNKPFDITFDTVAVEGDLINVITGFLPAGKATVQIPF